MEKDNGRYITDNYDENELMRESQEVDALLTSKVEDFVYSLEYDFKNKFQKQILIDKIKSEIYNSIKL